MDGTGRILDTRIASLGEHPRRCLVTEIGREVPVEELNGACMGVLQDTQTPFLVILQGSVEVIPDLLEILLHNTVEGRCFADLIEEDPALLSGEGLTPWEIAAEVIIGDADLVEVAAVGNPDSAGHEGLNERLLRLQVTQEVLHILL